MAVHDTIPAEHKTSRRCAHEIAQAIISIRDRLHGKAMATTSSVIAEYIGVGKDGTNQHIREAAKIVLVEHGFPLISCSKGFYFAATHDELREFSLHMEARIAGMQRSVDAIGTLIEKRSGWDDKQPTLAI